MSLIEILRCSDPGAKCPSDNPSPSCYPVLEVSAVVSTSQMVGKWLEMFYAQTSSSSALHWTFADHDQGDFNAGGGSSRL